MWSHLSQNIGFCQKGQSEEIVATKNNLDTNYCSIVQGGYSLGKFVLRYFDIQA